MKHSLASVVFGILVALTGCSGEIPVIQTDIPSTTEESSSENMEKQADPQKRDTGLFFFKGEPNAKFAVCNAGGGFAYVGAMQDSFPHALELSKLGYNAFSLIYRLGARMAAWVGSYGTAAFGGDDLPRPSAVIMQYTGYSEYSESDPPTFACVGESDGIANYCIMQHRLEALSALGIDTEFHSYSGLRHGFGIGTGTIAEGWLNQAVSFWERQNTAERN